GSQHVLDLDAEALLDAMSDDLLEEGDLWRALQRLFRQGAQNQDGQRLPGLQDLMQQLRQRRQQQLQRSNLNDTLKDIREKLQQQFEGMQQALQSMTPEDMRAIKEMLRDLNQMLDEKARGGDPDFQSFMDRWGQFFPGANSLDELIEQLQQRQAQMQSMLDSMSAEQRRELMQLMQSLVQDPGLRNELAMLAANLEELRPMDDLRRRYPFRGEDSVSFEQAMQVMQDLQEMDRLERQMREAIDTADPSSIDREMLERQLGEQAKDQLDQLDQITKMLEEAGLVERRGDQLELTPRAIRKIGQKA